MTADRTEEHELRAKLSATAADLVRLQAELNEVWDDLDARAAIWTQIQRASALHERASHQLRSIINFNSSSEANGAASLDTDSHTSRSDGVASGASSAGHAPHDPDRGRASSVAPNACQAIKKNGEACDWPASKGGKYAGEFCRLHATEAGKAAKRASGQGPDNYDPNSGIFRDDPDSIAHPELFNRRSRHREVEYDQKVMCDARGPDGFCLTIGERYTFTRMDQGPAAGGVHYLCKDERACNERTGNRPSNEVAE